MPIRVLVVEDDQDFQWLLRLSLQLEHDTTVVGVAAVGETGVDLALREQPDVVVMDLMMPRINGFEGTRRIKQIRPTVKVVVVTSFPVDHAICQQMYRSGVDALLRKADVATSLVPTIRSLYETDTSADSLLA
jgi:NarL family two-component system response regulator LiaR